MAGSRNGVPLLEVARQKALELVNAYRADDFFQIITADMEGKQQHLLTQDEARKEIEEIKISTNTASVGEILAKQKNALSQKSASRMAYLISDFQSNTLTKKLLPDSTMQTFALEVNADNVEN